VPRTLVAASLLLAVLDPVAASLLLAVLDPVAATAPAHGQASDKGCNVRLKGLKTLSDPHRNLVNLHPKNTTAVAINALPQPHPTPKTRSTDFSRRVWRVTAQIVEFKIEGDSDIHLVLFEEADTADDRHGAKFLPFVRRLTAARLEVLARGDNRLAISSLLGQNFAAGISAIR
jgi:hypothetical protein